MFYIRPGMEISISLAGNFPDLANGGGTVTTDSVSVQGNDVDVTFVGQAPASLDLLLKAKEDAVFGTRDIRIAYSDSNAVPVVAKDILTVLNVGCLGSQLWFFQSLTNVFPGGMPSIDEINEDKMWLAVLGDPFNPMRLWQWDTGDTAGGYGAMQYPRWDNTDPTTGPNIHRTVEEGRESGETSGYLTNNMLETNVNVFQWNDPVGSDAYACAPDEFVVQSGVAVDEQRWSGFPAPALPIGSMVNIPLDSFFRKPHCYMSTGDHFWNNEGISHPTKNQTWCGNGGAGQSRLTALPMWYRGTGSSFNPNYEEPFIRMRRVEQGRDPGTSFCGYNDNNGNFGVTTPHALMKGIMMLSIEPIQCVMPGPQTKFPSVGGQEKQNYSYKRRGYGQEEVTSRGKETLRAKIKVLYQDLFAFKDYYNGGGGAVNPGVHKMSDPIVLAEAYCPRIDVTYDYTEWHNKGQNTPSGIDVKDPKVTMESFPFEWKQIITSSEQVYFGESEHPDGGGAPVTGDYLNSHKEEIAKIAEYFIKEFEGYACQLKVNNAYWCPNGLPASDSQCFGAAATAGGRPYNDPIEDREGTFLAVAGYLEVVEK